MTSRALSVRLASETEAFCRVVTPDDARWRELGHKFCVRVREYTRTEPTQVTPDELTDEDYSRHNLVLFGSILDNPAILRLYARGRCFTDASYPGRDGAEIRTLLNPLGAGRDVLLIGGSDYASVHEAAIGLNRSFTDVSSEVNGVLCLHRLNFCVAPDHHVAGPVADEVQRALDIADDDHVALMETAAGFALNHYRSDDPAWADAVGRALRPCLDADTAPQSVSHLALAWGLVHAFPGYQAAFRADVDSLLTRGGQAAADRLIACENAALKDVADDCMSLIRVADHLESVAGARLWAAEEARAWQTLLRPDPGLGADGLRDWRAVDTWLGAVFRAERYDLLEGDILRRLVLDAVSERDNLGACLSDAAAPVHAEHALRKIAAYQDAGEPLWLRRWMQDARGNTATAAIPPGWYTGAYAPDRAPTPARDIPRIHVAEVDPPGDSARLVAMRCDLDAGGEYAAFRGDRLALSRLTWKGHTWFTDDSDASIAATNAGVSRVTHADMEGLGYVGAAAREAWLRQIVWRHGAFLIIADDGSTEPRATELTPAEGLVREGRAGSPSQVLRQGIAHVGLTRFSMPAESGSVAGREVSVISLGAEPAESLGGDARSFAIGPATCHIGHTSRDGALARAACTVLEDDAIWFVGLVGVDVDGVTQLASSVPVDLHLCPSRETGRVQAREACRLTWNDGADGVCLDAGEYDAQLGDFDWAGLARLGVR